MASSSMLRKSRDQKGQQKWYLNMEAPFLLSKLQVYTSRAHPMGSISPTVLLGCFRELETSFEV
jgi:hypothetical protein